MTNAFRQVSILLFPTVLSLLALGCGTKLREWGPPDINCVGGVFCDRRILVTTVQPWEIHFLQEDETLVYSAFRYRVIHDVNINDFEIARTRSGTRCFSAELSRYHNYSDVDGDGWIDVSFHKNDAEPYRLWTRTELLSVNLQQKSISLGSHFPAREIGIDFFLVKGQWHWRDHKGRLERTFETSLPKLPPNTSIDRQNQSFCVQQRHPISFPTPKHQATEKAAWNIDYTYWNPGPECVQWNDSDFGHDFLEIRTVDDEKVWLTMDDSRNYLAINLAEQVQLEIWHHPIRLPLPPTLTPGTDRQYWISKDMAVEMDYEDKYKNIKLFRRYRLRFMDILYEDMDGDGRLDGYHELGTNRCGILIDGRFFEMKMCDWEQGLANENGDETIDFCFSESQWKKI